MRMSQLFFRTLREAPTDADTVSHQLMLRSSLIQPIAAGIFDILPLAQSTVSQHLKELKTAGLINGTVDGPRSCYCINWKAFDKFNEEFSFLFNKLKVQNEKACC